MECQCENNSPEDDVPGFWMSNNSVQMGAFTVVGYLLYRFSQTLPFLIRWPIRLFCTLTGLSTLWSWISHLVGTLRGIQSLFKWLSRIWKFIGGLSSKFKGLVKPITGSSEDGAEKDPSSSSSLNSPEVRLILLGPTFGGRTFLVETLLGNSEPGVPTDPLQESTRRRAVIDGRDVTVIDTPDLLETSLDNNQRAVEALRSLQLASPGPHAILLAIPTPGSSMGSDPDAAQQIQATLKLFGDSAQGHLIPVLTYSSRWSKKRTVDQLLDMDDGVLGTALSVCDQRPELVDIRPDCPPEVRSVTRRQLVERVMAMQTQSGHFVHELQRREERMRVELLADMSSALAGKLGHV